MSEEKGEDWRWCYVWFRFGVLFYFGLSYFFYFILVGGEGGGWCVSFRESFLEGDICD